MKRIGRALRHLKWFALGGLFSSLAGSWSWFVPALVLAYLGSGLFGWLVSTLTLLPSVRRAIPRSHLIVQRRIAFRDSSAAFRIGQYLRWPAYALRAPRHLTSPILRGHIVGGRDLPKWFRLSMVMDPADELRYATTSAFLAFLALQWDLGGFAGRAWFLPTVAWVVGITIAGRHASYLLGQPDLAERARHGFGNPLLSFVKIGLVDYVATAVALVWLSGERFSNPSEGQIVGTAKALLRPADAFSVITDLGSVGRSVSEFGSFVLASLFSASIVAGLLRVKAFKRSDDDRIALANHALALGDPGTAAEQLAKVRNPSAVGALAQACVAVGQGDPERAWRWMKSQADIGGFERTELHTACALGMLVSNALMTYDALHAYLTDLRARGLPELAAVASLGSEGWILALQRPGEERTWWFESGLADQYPILTAAYLVLPVDGPRAAIERLALVRPTSPGDVVLSSLCRLRIHRVAELIGDQESRDACGVNDAWWERVKSSSNDLEIVALGSVSATAHAIADMYPSGDVRHRLLDLASEFDARFRREAAALGGEHFVDQFEELRNAYPPIRWPDSGLG